MSASTQWYQTNGAAPGVDTPQATTNGVNNWDFKSVDTAGVATAGEEITAGDFSMHAYVKLRFTGSFSSITNVKFYSPVQNVSGFGIGAYLLGSGVEAASYAQPVTTSKSGVWDPVPTVSASGIDISTADLAAGNAGFTDYAALQLKTFTSGAEAGFGGYSTWTIVYDEV